MTLAETRTSISRPTPLGDLLPNRENINGYEVLTTHERANGGQLLFMVSYQLNELTGRYETTLGSEAHQFGELPKVAHELFPQGRGFCYLTIQSPDNTQFLFGTKRVSPEKSFLALNWVSPVDLKRGNKQAERFVVRMDGFTYGRAEALMKKMLSNTETKDEGDGVISFNAEFDPFDQNNYLSGATKETVGLDNLLPQQKLIAQIENQTKARLLTHNPEQNSFEVRPIFLNGKYYVHDMVLDKYVLWEEVTSDQKSLSFIHDSERLTALYLKDPSRYKGPLIISFGVMLSARTAGFRNTPSSAVSQLTVNQFGEALQNTSIVPTQNVDPRLFDIAVSNWSLELRPEMIQSINSLQPASSPFSAGLYGGGMMVFPAVRNPEQPSMHEASILAFALAAPAIAESAFLGAPIIASAIVPAIAPELLASDLSSSSISDLPTEQSDIVMQDIGALPPDGNYPEETTALDDFPDMPVAPNTEPEPTGGGGLMMPREIETAVWDKRMEERFRQAKEPTNIFTDQVLPLEIKHEQVIFEDSQFPQEEEKKEPVFHQLAADLEVVQVENMNDSTLLLADIKEQSTALVEEVNKEEPKVENVFNAPELQETIHYDTAQYHSEEQISVVKPAEETLKKEPTIIKNRHKNMQLHNFVTDFSFNNLLLSYLRQRQILSELLRQNISTLDSPDHVELSTGDKPKEQKSVREDNNSFLKRAEKNKTQTKKLKLKISRLVTSPAFLSLLLLTKIKLLTKVKLLAKKNSPLNLAQLFLTDTLLLFLLNPKLFLVNKSTVAD